MFPVSKSRHNQYESTRTTRRLKPASLHYIECLVDRDIAEIWGINVQWPWSRHLIEGRKTVETRTYPIPTKHLNSPLAVIETPGRHRISGAPDHSTIIGIIVFSGCYQYQTRDQWAKDARKHLVPENDPDFAFNSTKPKWAWEVASAVTLRSPVLPPKPRGIVFCSSCAIPLNDLPPELRQIFPI